MKLSDQLAHENYSNVIDSSNLYLEETSCRKFYIRAVFDGAAISLSQKFLVKGMWLIHSLILAYYMI